MTHMKERLFFKLQFSDFTALVCYHTVVLFLLMISFGGHSKVISASQQIVAKIGDDIILPCQLEPAVDAVDLTVEWARFDLQPRFVLLRRDGVELVLQKHPIYRGRTSLSTNKLKNGDVSLKLSKVKPSDMGTYRCFVPSSGTKAEVELVVGSVSPPAIDISLVCKSKGWYPEPEVFWLDGEGHFLSAESTETVRGPDDLYTVDSRVTVENRQSNNFTCRVQQKIINQTRETHIYVPAAPAPAAAAPAPAAAPAAARISIFLAVCLLSVGAVVIVVWRAGRNKNKTTNNNNELLMKRERDRESEGEKMENTKENFEEDLKKNEEELKQVKQVISTLKVQKEHLKKQKDKIILFLQTDMKQRGESEAQIEENKNVPFFKKTKNLLENITKELKKRITEQQELLKATDEMIKTTDELIIEMVEKKGKLEKDKEQINKNLKETEKQRKVSEKSSVRDRIENK